MWFDGAKQSRFPLHLFATPCFSLGVRRPGAWSHLQMIVVGLVTCPQLALTTSSANNTSFVALLFATKRQHHRRRIFHHILSEYLFSGNTHTPLRIDLHKACLSRDWRAFDTTFPSCVLITTRTLSLSPTYTLHLINKTNKTHRLDRDGASGRFSSSSSLSLSLFLYLLHSQRCFGCFGFLRLS